MKTGIRLARLLFLALAALGAAPAAAVHLSPNGVGQALLFPYYTVRSAAGNQYNTYISVTNTARDAVVAKVRFREGRNSRLVAEFNLYLAAGDMWTAALVPEGEGTRLVTRDKSCTNPALPAAGLDFSNASFSGGDDGAGTGLERTREGHFEFIEMATMPLGANFWPDFNAFDCTPFQGASPALGDLRPPSRGLTGTATLINVNSGLDSTYAAEALANLTTAAFYSHPGAPGTDFDAPQVDPVSHATVGNVSYRMLWSRGIEAVNSVFMSEYVENEFVLDAQTLSKTDWVFAFPTRRFFVSTTGAQAPFSAPFGPSPDGRWPCEGIRGEVANREASGGSLLGDFGIEPPSHYRQCWSAAAFPVRHGTTVTIPVGSSDVLGAANTLGWTSAFMPIGPLPPWGAIGVPEEFFNGRLSLRFETVGAVSSLRGSSWVDLATGAVGTGPVRLSGLPVAGFMVRTFENGTLSCGGGACQGNYASAMPHRRIMRILAAP